jgi:hypothetical protein
VARSADGSDGGTRIRDRGDALVDEGVMTLVDRFLRQRSYDRTFALELFDIARARRSTRWETRRLAVLMLEHQLLKIPDTDEIEFAFWLTRLECAGQRRERWCARRAQEGYRRSPRGLRR